MPIDATSPTVVQATFDKWAIAELRQTGDGLAAFGDPSAPPIVLYARLVKYRVRDDGVSERSPFPADSRDVTIPDLYDLAAKDIDVASALAELVSVVAKVAGQKGLL